MFFVNALTFYYTGNLGDATLHMQDVIRCAARGHASRSQGPGPAVADAPTPGLVLALLQHLQHQTTTAPVLVSLTPAARSCTRRHIRERFPYWNASGGADHFYFALNDRGACTLNTTQPDVWAPIKLVHFGAYSKNVSGELGITRYDMLDGSPVRVGAGC